jgi:hypothetical protein
MNMTGISKCAMSKCAYNSEGSCHTPGITVGPHAECNTYVHHSSRGGFQEVKGGIGACLAASCKFNDKLECQAPAVNVTSDDKHADRSTFEKKE